MRSPAILLMFVRCGLAAPLRGLSVQLQTVEKLQTHTHPELWSEEFWIKIGLSMLLVLAGGLFAGLTLGLMGLDQLHLRVLATSSEDPSERENARKVLELLQYGRHWVLVVLLLGNVIINESLPIFLDSAIGGGLAAVALSTTAIVIFGIIPQAINIRHGLRIGAFCAPLVRALMWFLAPVAWPIAKVLDGALGANEAHTYKKAELKSFLQLHASSVKGEGLHTSSAWDTSSSGSEAALRDDELSILQGVLELSAKSVEGIMTPMEDVVTLSADDILDDRLVESILHSGYSRFPVHEAGDPDSFIGILLIKKLVRYDPSLALPVSSFPLSILPAANPSISCFQALDYFQTGRAHLLLITRTPGEPGGAIGVITLEDIIEEILSEEIVDETDRYEDNVSKQHAKRVITASAMFGILEHRRGASASRRPSMSDRTPLLSDTASVRSSINNCDPLYGKYKYGGMSRSGE